MVTRGFTLIVILIFGTYQVGFSQIDDPIIHNVRLFDGDSVYDNVTVSTKNGVITQISEVDDIEKTANYIDGSGFTLIPGMINAHIHLGTKKHLVEAIKSGVLCLLDLKIDYGLDYARLKELSQEPQFPYIFSANHAVTVPKGHASGKTAIKLKTEEGATKLVEELVTEGVDFIKIMLDHGYGYNMPTLSDDMLKSTIQVAKKNNLLSVAHISRHQDAIKAAELGINGFAHVWLFDSIPISDEGIQMLKSHNTFVTPTLIVFQRGVERKGNPSNMEFLKSEVLRLYQAGIPILAGSDPPNYNVNYGSDLIEELKLFVELGMPEIEALKSATSNTSRAFKLGQIGFVKENASADFVLIKGNPLEEIEALYNIEGIWKMGQFIAPENKN